MKRFWNKVVKRTNGCWEWTASIAWNGYGRFKYAGKMALAHRVSYILKYGPVPDGMMVCHTCDNRKCVNPDHLFLGSHQDNMDDMVTKGRGATKDQTRAKNGNAKLSENDVMTIKGRLEQGDKNTHIAKDFGVHHSTISAIKRSVSW